MSTNYFGLADNLDLEDTVRLQKEERAAEQPAEAPVNPELQNTINKATVSCFGGMLFYRENHMISFAAEGMTKREITAAKEHYQRLAAEYHTQFLHGSYENFIEQTGNYTVFNFTIRPDMESLRSYLAHHTMTKDEVMTKLVRLIAEHSNKSVPYLPLNCISLDTVFVDAQKALWLLPLQAVRKNFPVEIAPEARDPDSCDATSDLYAAAFVSVEAAAGGALGTAVSINDSTIEKCLIGIRQCRPLLTSVYNILCKNRQPAGENRPTAEGKKPNEGFTTPLEDTDFEVRMAFPKVKELLTRIGKWLVQAWYNLRAKLQMESVQHITGTLKNEEIRQEIIDLQEDL